MATNNLPDSLPDWLYGEFRTAPPWKGAKYVPAQYEILAEFPYVQWEWECDGYQWILRDRLSGEVFLGGTSQQKIDALAEEFKRRSERNAAND
jgi:hypothetical protein